MPNTAPDLQGIGPVLFLNDYVGSTVLAPGATVFDIDLGPPPGNFGGASITLKRAGDATSQDQFGLAGGFQIAVEGGPLAVNGVQFGVVTKNSGGVLTLTFNDQATQTLVNQALQSITYVNLGSNPGNSEPTNSDDIQWTFSDGNTGGQGTGGALFDTVVESVTYTSVPPALKIDDPFMLGDDNPNGLSGRRGDNVIDGAGGNDTLMGNQGDDTLYGGAGNDVLNGGAGKDELFGQDGDDFLVGEAGADTLDGGLGRDRVLYLGSNTGVTVDLVSGGSGGHAAGDKYISIEDVEGSYGNDRIYGDAGANTFFATFGNDVYNGRDGADVYVFSKNKWNLQIAFGGAARTLAKSIGVTLTGTDRGIAVKTGGAPGAEQWLPAVQYDLLLNVEGFKGSNGNDSITGNTQDNLVFVSPGSDTLDGGGGFNYLATQSGDRVNLTTGTVLSGDGLSSSTVSHFQGVVGNAGNETMIGDAKANRLEGRAGRDALSGMAGNDQILGGDGDDLVQGGAGNDLLDGGLGADLLDGGDGIDTVSYLEADAGVSVDLLKAVGGGAAGSESLGDRYVRIENVVGSEQDDYIQGDKAANVLAGDRGSDQLLGCDGNDVIYGDISPLPLGELPEAAYFAALDKEQEVNCDCDDHDDEDDLDAIELGNRMDTIDGGNGDDLIFGQRGSDFLNGNCGDDRLFGGTEADILVGGEGDDILTGEGSFDFLFGGTGLDIASYSSSASAVNVDLSKPWSASGGDAAGNLVDELLAQILSTTNFGQAFFASSFASIFAALNSALDASSDKPLFAIADVMFDIEGLQGSDFNDTLKGDAGANSLAGGDGDDSLSGNDGNDTLIGGNGDDTLDGGNGSDTASYVGAAAGVTVNLALKGAQNTSGAGIDTLILIENLAGSSHADVLDGNAGTNTLSGGSKNDILRGGDGNDTLNGGTGNDMLDGGAGTNTASYEDSTSAVTVDLGLAGAQNTGGAGIDTLIGIQNLTGGLGADKLTGDGQSNTLVGGDGDDRLTGGGGSDLLVGGAGFDDFIFNSDLVASNVDVIRNFDAASDEIWLQNAIFTSLTPTSTGKLDAGAFKLGAAATDADDRIVFNSSNGKLFYDADGVGGQAAVQFATLTGVDGKVTNANFILF